MASPSFRTKEDAEIFAECLNQSQVKWIDIEQDSDGRWVVMYTLR